MNVAVAAASAGHPARVVAVVGREALPLLRTLAELLDIAGVCASPSDPSCQFILAYDSRGTLVPLKADYGAADRLTAHALKLPLASGHHHVCCRRPLEPGPVLTRLAWAGISFSIGFTISNIQRLAASARAWLPAATFIFVNRQEAAALTEFTDPAVLPALIVTDGADAVRWFSCGAELGAHDPPAVTPAEVTGAGDAFIGGFLAATLRRARPAVCLHAGVNSAQAALKSRTQF